MSDARDCVCRHVNRKALDEYASFTEQKTELKRRQEENARGEAKIKQLIQTLDLRKDEAIERTFKAGLPITYCLLTACVSIRPTLWWRPVMQCLNHGHQPDCLSKDWALSYSEQAAAAMVHRLQTFLV